MNMIWILWISKLTFKIRQNWWILGNFKICKIRILNLCITEISILTIVVVDDADAVDVDKMKNAEQLQLVLSAWKCPEQRLS